MSFPKPQRGDIFIETEKPKHTKLQRSDIFDSIDCDFLDCLENSVFRVGKIEKSVVDTPENSPQL